MKKIMILTALLAVLCSCSDRFDIGHEIDSCVYLLKPGEQKVKLTPDNAEFKVWVCKGGYDSKSYTVKAVIDDEDITRYTAETKKSYTPMPGNAYELTISTVKLSKDEIKAPVVISFDLDCVAKGATFILPVRISCDQEGALENGKDVTYLIITK